jgi:hypothetical protein
MHALFASVRFIDNGAIGTRLMVEWRPSGAWQLASAKTAKIKQVDGPENR